MTSPADLPSMPEIPTSVTHERLAALLVPDGWTAEGEERLRRRWRGVEIVATLQRSDGLVLLFTGTRLGTEIPLARQPEAEAFVNDWHRDRIWPTLVLGTTPTALVVSAVVAVDGTEGLTDAQLGEYVRIGVGTTHQCFQALDDAPGLGPAGPPSADPDPR